MTCGFFSGSASRREKDVGKPLKMIMTFDNEDDHYHHDDHYFGDDHFKIRACDNFFFVGVVVIITR